MNKFWLRFFGLIFLTFVVGGFFLYELFLAKEPISRNVVFVVDISHSMNVIDQRTSDGSVSRLDAVKLGLYDVLHNSSYDKFGLVVFAGKVSYLVPLTADTGSLIQVLTGLHTNLLPGTPVSFGKVIDFLAKNTNEPTDYFVFSDFDDIDLSLKNSLSNLFLVGVGREDGGWVLYPNGNFVKSAGQNIKSAFSSKKVSYLASELGARFLLINESWKLFTD